MLLSTRHYTLPGSQNDQLKAMAGQTPLTGRMTLQEGVLWLPVNSSHRAQTTRRTLKLPTITTDTEVIAAPFPDPPAVPETPVAKEKAPENVQTDALAPSGRVGGGVWHTTGDSGPP